MAQPCCHFDQGVRKCSMLEPCECYKINGTVGPSDTNCTSHYNFNLNLTCRVGIGACCRYYTHNPNAPLPNDGEFNQCTQELLTSCIAANGIWWGENTVCTGLHGPPPGIPQTNPAYVCRQARWVNESLNPLFQNPIGSCVCYDPNNPEHEECYNVSLYDCGVPDPRIGFSSHSPCSAGTVPHFVGSWIPGPISGGGTVPENAEQQTTHCKLNPYDHRWGVRNPSTSFDGRRFILRTLEACCTVNSPFCQDLTEEACCRQSFSTNVGQGTSCATHSCIDEPEPTGCRTIEPDELPLDRLGWTADLCAHAFFEPYIRTPEEYPTNDPEFEPGFVEFLSVHPIRGEPLNSVEWEQHGEPCAYHYARMGFIAGNIPAVVFCTSNGTSEDDKSVSVAGMYYYHGDETLEEGAACFVGSYPTPRWYEIQYHSTPVLCEEPLS